LESGVTADSVVRQKSKSLCLAHVTAMQPAEEPEADGYCGSAC
jgi:hypothetical protein